MENAMKQTSLARRFRFTLLAALTALSPLALGAGGKPVYLVVGNDDKVSFDDTGKTLVGASGNDSVSIVDIGSTPVAPKIVVNLPLANSIVGPPTNVAIT